MKNIGNPLIALGFFLLFLGVIFSLITAKTNEQEPRVQWGIGGVIGFLPFGFANSPGMLWFVIGLSVILIIVNLVVRNLR